jgi:hypothetical protein
MALRNLLTGGFVDDWNEFQRRAFIDRVSGDAHPERDPAVHPDAGFLFLEGVRTETVRAESTA